ncbi:MAG: UDP-2,3-diacylglucosamine diphosphatase LpxI [Alphaproteobacteria bacterium]|nr:UDP-2,3-diacylglucosamine diphosphatase LpxI [Alphaproteobacteria bacterium]OJU57282.1 MAG: hypothetical protein BGO00_02860 [Alphaproteobacteria bacterium 62-8]
MTSPLGIVAGGGDLPRAVAVAARDGGRGVFVLALAGLAGDWVDAFAHERASVGEAGKIVRALGKHDCHDVLLAGQVDRPRIGAMKLDAKGALLMPRVAAAALQGDDALLRLLVQFFEEHGHHVVGVAEAAPSLLAPDGPIGRFRPNTEHLRDIAHGFAVVKRLGELDVGQGAVVCAGLVLAVEAAQGTDVMLEQVAALPEGLRGTERKRRGVLVKAPKPIQDGKTDLPVVGISTVRNAAAAGLAGIAVQSGAALIVDRAEVAMMADHIGLFVAGASAGL